MNKNEFKDFALWCQKHYLDIVGTGYNNHPETINGLSCMYLAFSYVYHEYEGLIKEMWTIKATEICLNVFEHVYHIYGLLFPQVQFLFNQFSTFNDYTAQELHLSDNDFKITKDLFEIISRFEKNYEYLDMGILKKDFRDILDEVNNGFDKYLKNNYKYYIGTPKKDFVDNLIDVQDMLKNGLIE